MKAVEDSGVQPSLGPLRAWSPVEGAGHHPAHAVSLLPLASGLAELGRTPIPRGRHFAAAVTTEE